MERPGVKYFLRIGLEPAAVKAVTAKMVLTPDGPTDPCYHVQPGSVS